MRNISCILNRSVNFTSDQVKLLGQELFWDSDSECCSPKPQFHVYYYFPPVSYFTLPLHLSSHVSTFGLSPFKLCKLPLDLALWSLQEWTSTCQPGSSSLQAAMSTPSSQSRSARRQPPARPPDMSCPESCCPRWPRRPFSTTPRS